MVGRWAHLWLLPSSSWLMCHLLKIDWCKKGRGSSKSFNIRFHLQLTLVDSAPWVLGFLVDNCMLPFVFASLVRFPLARLVDTFYVLDGFRICLVKCNIVQFCLLLYTIYAPFEISINWLIVFTLRKYWYIQICINCNISALFCIWKEILRPKCSVIQLLVWLDA